MPLIQFSLLAVLALAGTARAGFLNEPEFTKGAPPTVDFYELISSSEIGAYAAHANHGVGTFDGSVIATGTYGAEGVPDSDEPDKLNQNGFVVKADSKGKKVWQFRHETPGRYGSVLAAVEGPESDGYPIYAAGIAWVTSAKDTEKKQAGSYDRVLYKLNAKTGALIWQATFPDSQDYVKAGVEHRSMNGVIEFVDLDRTNGDLLLSGSTNWFPGGNIGEFKSGGKPDLGAPCWAAKIKAAALEKAVPVAVAGIPTVTFAATDFAWNNEGMVLPAVPNVCSSDGECTLASGTSIRAIPGTGEAVLLSRAQDTRPKNEGAGAAVVTATRIKADGTVNWHTVLSKQGQGADIAVSPKHDYIVVGGLGTSTDVGMVGSGGTQGMFTRLDAATGKEAWAVLHGHDNMYVGVECWGVQIVADKLGEGVVAACGMGAEVFSCKDIPLNDTTYWTATRKAACDDPPNGFGMRWRNYNVRVDPSDGKIVWQRVDSYMSNEGVTENGATEYIALMRDGGAVAINDNDSGIGLLKLMPLDGGVVGGGKPPSSTAAGTASAVGSAGGSNSSSSAAGTTSAGTTAGAGITTATIASTSSVAGAPAAAAAQARSFALQLLSTVAASCALLA